MRLLLLANEINCVIPIHRLYCGVVKAIAWHLCVVAMYGVFMQFSVGIYSIDGGRP